MITPSLTSMPNEILALILNDCVERDLISVKRLGSRQLNEFVKEYFEEHKKINLNNAEEAKDFYFERHRLEINKACTFILNSWPYQMREDVAKSPYVVNADDLESLYYALYSIHLGVSCRSHPPLIIFENEFIQLPLSSAGDRFKLSTKIIDKIKIKTIEIKSSFSYRIGETTKKIKNFGREFWPRLRHILVTFLTN